MLEDGVEHFEIVYQILDFTYLFQLQLHFFERFLLHGFFR